MAFHRARETYAERVLRALGVGLSHPGGLCRQSLRNVRPAAQPRPAPPLARCFTRADPPRLSSALDENSVAGRDEKREALATVASRNAIISRHFQRVSTCSY
jgi:hypothetical protein